DLAVLVLDALDWAVLDLALPDFAVLDLAVVVLAVVVLAVLASDGLDVVAEAVSSTGVSAALGWPVHPPLASLTTSPASSRTVTPSVSATFFRSSKDSSRRSSTLTCLA